jgi:hypothetical protein
MRTIKNKDFGHRRLKKTGIIENVRFENCTFGSGLFVSLGIRKPEDSFIIRDCEFVKCTFDDHYGSYGGLHIGQAKIENVLIENCKTKGSFGVTLNDTLLKHVTIKGKFDKISIYMPTNEIRYELQYLQKSSLDYYGIEKQSDKGYYYIHHSPYAELEEVFALRDAFFEHYASVDWALDISQAKIGYTQIYGHFPYDKIRFDLATAAYIPKDKLLENKWREEIAGMGTGLSRYGLNDSFKLKTEGHLIITTNGKAEYYNEELAVIKKLREAGIAEPGPTAEPMTIPPKKVKPAVNFKKPVFVFRVTVWTYDHGDGILLANHASSAKKKMMELLDDLEPDAGQYTAKREKQYDAIAGMLGEKIWHEEEEAFVKLLENIKK